MQRIEAARRPARSLGADALALNQRHPRAARAQLIRRGTTGHPSPDHHDVSDLSHAAHLSPFSFLLILAQITPTIARTTACEPADTLADSDARHPGTALGRGARVPRSR